MAHFLGDSKDYGTQCDDFFNEEIDLDQSTPFAAQYLSRAHQEHADSLMFTEESSFLSTDFLPLGYTQYNGNENSDALSLQQRYPEKYRKIETLQNANRRLKEGFNKLIDEMCLSTSFEMHRKLKTGLLCLNCEYSDVIDKPGCDIFGQPITDLQPTDSFPCGHCARAVTAGRYAPHLEKCMGMGRSSSRIANKRLASEQMFEVSAPREGAEKEKEESDSDRDYCPLEKRREKSVKNAKKPAPSRSKHSK